MIVSDVVGFKGEIVYDSSKPDGTPRKLMDVTRLKDLGWSYKTELNDGIEKAYEWFVNHYLKNVKV
jgi:GDP-L-fucose synthase